MLIRNLSRSRKETADGAGAHGQAPPEGFKSSKAATKVSWKGVIPAITTPFNADFNVDHYQLVEHCRWLAGHDVAGIMPIGALGEGPTLRDGEKRHVIETCVRAVGDRVPIVLGIAAFSTPEAVALARHARTVGRMPRADGHSALLGDHRLA